MKRARAIVLFIALTSCAQERQYKRFAIPSIDAQVVAYTEAAWHTTASDSWRLALRMEGEEITILKGSEPRKLDIEYDEERRTIIVLYCGGDIESFQSIVAIHGVTYAIQPIMTPFEVEASQSDACAGSTFYSIQGH